MKVLRVIAVAMVVVGIISTLEATYQFLAVENRVLEVVYIEDYTRGLKYGLWDNRRYVVAKDINSGWLYSFDVKLRDGLLYKKDRFKVRYGKPYRIE